MERSLYGTFLFDHFIQHASFTHSGHLNAFYLTATHIHTLTNTLESNLGFSMLLSDTLANRLKLPVIKPTTF